MSKKKSKQAKSRAAKKSPTRKSRARTKKPTGKGTKKPAKKTPRKVSKVPSRYRVAAQEKTSKQAFDEITERLEDARGVLTAAAGIDSRVRVHKYKDGSVDGELLVKVPRGTSSDDVAMEIENAVGRQGMPGFWINMGVRMTIEEDEEVYRRMRGMNDVNTHYQAAVPANWSEIPFIVRKVIIKGMEKKYGRKSDSVYLRIHWSRNGDKPRNRG